MRLVEIKKGEVLSSVPEWECTLLAEAFMVGMVGASESVES